MLKQAIRKALFLGRFGVSKHAGAEPYRGIDDRLRGGPVALVPDRDLRLAPDDTVGQKADPLPFQACRAR